MRLLLIDGTNVVMRYAFAALRDGQASPTWEQEVQVLGAVESALRACAAAAGCRHAVVALDSTNPTWRHREFPSYKATRPAISTGSWGSRLELYLGERGWLCCRVDGFEADDIAATLASRVQGARHDAAVLSGDSDLLQLAGDECHVYQFGAKGEHRFALRDQPWIAQRYGLRWSSQLGLYKAMVGEPGDNLPGVAGIGPTKARRLLRQYATAAEMLEAGVFARPNRGQLNLMLRLVTLREDVPLPAIQPASCRIPAAAGQEGQ